MQEISVFDVIGPVMVGPSSSHTAGAVRLGLIARAIIGAQPDSALIELHGSFAQTGHGHGTDKALVAGLLGFAPHDERIPASLLLAPDLRLDCTILPVDLGDQAHPNTARLMLQHGDARTIITGASIGGGQVVITRINEFAVQFSGDYHTLVIQADDRPGTIKAVSGCLSDHAINIATLNVTRAKRGGQAMMIAETDEPISVALLDDLHAFDWLRWLRRVNRIEEGS